MKVTGETKTLDILGRSMLSREQVDITTYHEAGHAVMAMAHGFVVTEMSNIASDAGMGYVKWQVPTPLTRASRISAVLVLAAGMAADFIHWKRSGSTENEDCLGHSSDLEQAEVHLAKLGDEGLFDTYLAIAIRFLRVPSVWELVELFAGLMKEAGTINGRELIQRAAKTVPKFGSKELGCLQLALDQSKRALL
ncbi:hypothetical protein I5K39_08640 [Pseudomonas aeruginosa]|nr:hypothetical protein [Pseudomonas aeruginosa]